MRSALEATGQDCGEIREIIILDKKFFFKPQTAEQEIHM